MRQFLTIFAGQMGSVIGSGLTSFALGVYVYQQTGSATDYAMILLATFLPAMIVSPLAGPLVDRFNRRTVMICTDSFAAMGTFLLLFLIRTGEIQIWHVYLVTTISATATAFQQPAYFAAISQLVDKKDLIRANGLVRTADGLQRLISPALAAYLLGTINLRGIIWIDIATFLFAVGTLIAVRVPDLPRTGVKTTLLNDMKEGFSYLLGHKPFLALLALVCGFNFFAGILMATYTPMVLSFATVQELGFLMSVFGGSLFIGGLILATKGAPQDLVKTIFLSMGCYAIATIIAGLWANPWTIALASVLAGLTMPFTMACSQTIWQKKVPHKLQGRIHSTRIMCALAATPIAYVLAGPLIDNVFRPMMTPGHPLEASLSPIFGLGADRGMGVLMTLMGVLNMIFITLLASYKPLRNIESIIPDATA